MKKNIVIGISGASGSGKTLIANTIIERLGADRVGMIQEDSYYKDLSNIPYDDRTGKNFDHPDAFDHNLLFDHMQKLINGESIDHPIYNYKTHSRLAETERMDAHKVIILEGILILNEPQLRDIMDIRVFVDTPPDVCFIRRLQRDIAERGRDVPSIVRQYMETVRPMYFQFVEPSKRYADLIIPRGGKNYVAIDLLTTKMQDLLREL